jgi:hypothetical protein
MLELLLGVHDRGDVVVRPAEAAVRGREAIDVDVGPEFPEVPQGLVVEVGQVALDHGDHRPLLVRGARVGAVGEPEQQIVVVAADRDHRREFAHHGHDLGRVGVVAHQVAHEDGGVEPLPARVAQHRRQRRAVAVHVAEDQVPHAPARYTGRFAAGPGRGGW